MILVARWRAAMQILELRSDITESQSKDSLKNRRAALWDLLNPAFGRMNFLGVDVDELLRSLTYDRAKKENREAYSVRRLELLDPRSGTIKMYPFDAEDLDNEPGRVEALEAMRKAGFVPLSVRVHWKIGDAEKDWVQTVLEKTDDGPELRILKKTPVDTYENVFSRITHRL